MNNLRDRITLRPMAGCAPGADIVHGRQMMGPMEYGASATQPPLIAMGCIIGCASASPIPAPWGVCTSG